MAIINEAINNVIRHAQATKVHIKAEVNSGRLHVEVTDNGVGIPAELEAGYGLRNMQDRARMLGGEIQVVKRDNGGTRVTLDIPWEDGNR